MPLLYREPPTARDDTIIGAIDDGERHSRVVAEGLDVVADVSDDGGRLPGTQAEHGGAN